MSEPWGVSIIVVNYNNDRFLTVAIDSAFGQEYLSGLRSKCLHLISRLVRPGQE